MKKYLVMALLVVCGLAAQTFAAVKTAEGDFVFNFYFDSAVITFSDGSTDDALFWGFDGLEIPEIDFLTSGVFATDIGGGSASGNFDATINGEQLDDFANLYSYFTPGDVMQITYSGEAMSDTPNSIQNVSVVVDLTSSFDTTGIGLGPDETLTLGFSVDYDLSTTLNNALPLPDGGGSGAVVGAEVAFEISSDTQLYSDPAMVDTAFGDLLNDTPTMPSESNGFFFDAEFGDEDYYGEIRWDTNLFVGVSTGVPEPATLSLLALGGLALLRRR